MTARERICLEFLTDKMESRAHEVGVAIVHRFAMLASAEGSNYSAVASNVLGALRRRGLVTYLPDLKAWRITAKGRAAL